MAVVVVAVVMGGVVGEVGEARVGGEPSSDATRRARGRLSSPCCVARHADRRGASSSSPLPVSSPQSSSETPKPSL